MLLLLPRWILCSVVNKLLILYIYIYTLYIYVYYCILLDGWVYPNGCHSKSVPPIAVVWISSLVGYISRLLYIDPRVQFIMGYDILDTENNYAAGCSTI